MYVVVSVALDGVLVKCGDRLVAFDLDRGVQKIDFIRSKIHCKLGVGVS